MSLANLILIFAISLSLNKLAIIDLGECQCSRNIIAKTPESTLKKDKTDTSKCKVATDIDLI
jgi:hypothetical protein